MTTAPVFEIGPGNLRWGGVLLRAGSKVPEELLATLVEDDGDWSIPGFPNCTRPVRKTGFVREDSDEAELVAAQQENKRLTDDLDGAIEANRELVKERSSLRGKLTRLTNKLTKLESGEEDED